MKNKIDPEILRLIVSKKAPYRAMNRKVVSLLETDPHNGQLLLLAEWIRQRYLEIIREYEEGLS